MNDTTSTSQIGKSLEERQFEFEQNKHDDEARLNERKIALQEKELSQKRSDPVLVVVVGGVIAALANAGVSYYTGAQQITLETKKHEHNLVSEKYKAEASHVSDATKSHDQVQNACQLNFLLEFELVTNETLKSRVNQFLRDKRGAEVSGPGYAASDEQKSKNEYTTICKISTFSPSNIDAVVANSKATPPKTPPDLPTPEKKLIQSLPFSTGWIGGGHSQAEACGQAIARYQGQYPGKILEAGEASEQSRKDWKGHVSYNYSCIVNVFDVINSKR